jgi:diaminopimelate decarboxylase
LKLEGIHSHIGSQILDSAAFRLNAEILLEFRMNLLKDSDINLDVVNFGGGFGVAYVTEEIKEIKCICDIMSSMAEVFAEYSKIENGLPTTICFEPGRFISAPSMVSVYTVGTTKDVALENGNSRRYISIDGGMSDNIRPALYKADYEAFLVSRESEAPLISSKVVGKYCESGDFIINSQELPSDIKRGDILCVPTTGAYSYSMASNYNSTYRLPIIQIGSGDEPKLIIRRECAEDLLRREV